MAREFADGDSAYDRYVSLTWCQAAQVSKGTQKSKEANLRKGETGGGDAGRIDPLNDAQEMLRKNQRLLAVRYQRERCIRRISEFWMCSGWGAFGGVSVIQDRSSAEDQMNLELRDLRNGLPSVKVPIVETSTTRTRKESSRTTRDPAESHLLQLPRHIRNNDRWTTVPDAIPSGF